LKTITVNGVQANFFDYDRFGRQIKLQDRDAGLTKYVYNAYGELESQTDANNKTYNFSYDALGNLTSKLGPDGTYTYQYAAFGPAANNLIIETAPNGYYTKYFYDSFGRNDKVEEYINGNSYLTRYQFDNFSRVEKTFYPSNFCVKNVYNNYGHLSQIINEATNQAIWICNSTNSLGKVSSFTSGNAKITQCTYNSYGYLTQLNTPNVQNMSYDYNLLNGNLKSRSDLILNKIESFTFDNLDRLNQTQVSSLPGLTALLPPNIIGYDNSGRILNKGNIGAFTYHNTKPDAINNVSNPSGVINTAATINNQNISYTPFNKILNIVEGVYSYDVFYGCDQQRRLTKLYNNGNLNYTRVFVGDYEKTIAGSNTSEVHYINSPTGLCAMYVINNGVGTMYYIYTDNQGTITKATNASGTIVADLNYDAWGRRRNNSTLDYANPSLPPNWLYRGYTCHEHLPEFALINMNGRTYDPVLGVMLSPDPFNQNNSLTQNYNRYSYAYNNPLKYSDPSGNFIIPFMVIAIVAVLVAGAINVALHSKQIAASDNPWRDGLVAFGIGAVGGLVGVATGGACAAMGAGLLAVMLGGGATAVMQEATTNIGNNIYFHDPLNTIKDYNRTFVYGAGTSALLWAAGKGVDKIVESVKPKPTPKYPNISGEANGINAGEAADPQLSVKNGQSGNSGVMPEPSPQPIKINEAPQTTLNRTTELDGSTSIYKIDADNWSINHQGDVNNYMARNKWTPEQITETLRDGQNMGRHGTVRFGPNKGNPTIRIHNNALKKSLIYDPKASEIIQLGKTGYTWTPF
jgi:RHS repeat-associated protein